MPEFDTRDPLPRLFVVVPVFNEAANIPRLMASFAELTGQWAGRYAPEFLLIDDGSADATVEVCRQHSAGVALRVLTHSENRGPGHAFGTAFEHLAEELAPTDWVITMEGDNTSRAEVIEHMLRRATEGYDVVLASPYMYGGGIIETSPMRTFISHVANLFVKELLGIHGILTMSSFFRMYRGGVLRGLQAQHGPRIVERNGFECMIELLLKLIYAGATISEVPMVLDGSRRRGKSKMNVSLTMLGYLSLWHAKRRWQHAATRAGAIAAAKRASS